METKLVSIAMCTYNGAKFLEKQLYSILNQTYSNIEIIICDDCSSDNTKDLLLKYRNIDKRIKVFFNENNLGFKKNFEKAITLCNGEYIALSDQDDIWDLTKIESFVDSINDNLLIYSDAILIDENSKEIDGNTLITTQKRELISGKCNKSLLLANCISGNTLMFKKELVKSFLPIPDNISFHDIWIAFVASTVGTISYTKKPLTFYRRYSEQVTSTREKDYKGFFDRLKKKEKIRIENAKNIIKDLECFLFLEKQLDSELINFINILINHYKNYENIFFNFSLFILLLKNKDKIFAIYSKKSRLKRVFRTSIGLKLHKISFFIL